MGCLANLPAAVVFQRVVPPAEMRQILGACCSAICCGYCVIEVAAMQRRAAARKSAVQVARAEHTAHLLARSIPVDANDFASMRVLGDDLPVPGIGSLLPRFGGTDRARTDEFGRGKGDLGERFRRKVGLGEECSVSDEHLYARLDIAASPAVFNIGIVASARSDLIAVSSCEIVASGGGQKIAEDVGTQLIASASLRALAGT